MTAIAIWVNHESAQNPALWIAADSRVGNGDSSLIDDAAKLFGLSVVLRSPASDFFFSETYYTHCYGYCFAGSTLIGQNSYLALAPLLSNLVSSTSYVPSLADVAKYVGSYLSLTFSDYKGGGNFEGALFGHCSRSGKLSVFHYKSELDEYGVYKIICVPHEDMKDKEFIYLGAEKAFMSRKIEEAFSSESEPGRPLTRAPRYIIQDHIEAQTFPSIGGSIQLGIADRSGFRPFTVCKPRIHGQSATYLSYLGRELTSDLQSVGEAMVSGPAIV